MAKLNSSGNPIIEKGFGPEVVDSYIKAMPGWKNEVGALLDELIVQGIPKVEKAVKWNTPFYGFQDKGWHIAFYCFKNYVQVTFFDGDSLEPPPPVKSKQPSVRYLNIYEDKGLDRKQFLKWVKQAKELPGEKL